jgi:uncharacterized membrane protein YgcG
VKKLPLLAAVAALAAPGTAAAAQQRGIVVKADVNTHLVMVAQKTGQVVRVHAPTSHFARKGKRFHVGQRIVFAAHKLPNGTLVGSSFRITGHARRVIVHGVVHAYSPLKQRITLATGGAILRMKLAPSGARTLMASAPPPKVGDEVTVTASVDENDDALEATEVDDDQATDDAQASQSDDQQADDNDGQQTQDDEQAEQDDQASDDNSAQGSGSENGSGGDSSSDDGGSDGSGSGDD